MREREKEREHRLRVALAIVPTMATHLIVPGELRNHCGCGNAACPHCVLECRPDVAFDVVWHEMFEYLTSPNRPPADDWMVNMKLMAFGMIAAQRYGEAHSNVLVNELQQLDCKCPFRTSVVHYKDASTSSSAAPVRKRPRTTTCPVAPTRTSSVSHTEHAPRWPAIWDTVWPIWGKDSEWVSRRSSSHAPPELAPETHDREYAEFTRKRQRASGSPFPPYYWCLNAGGLGEFDEKTWVWVSAEINEHVEAAWKQNWTAMRFSMGITEYTYSIDDITGKYMLTKGRMEMRELRRFPIRRRFDV